MVLNTLDKFLEIRFYSQDALMSGLEAKEWDRVDSLIQERENALTSALRLNLDIPTDYAKFDRILELADSYRKDESKYLELVNYVEQIAEVTR